MTFFEGGGKQDCTDVLQGPLIVASRPVTRLQAKQDPTGEIIILDADISALVSVGWVLCSLVYDVLCISRESVKTMYFLIGNCFGILIHAVTRSSR